MENKNNNYRTILDNMVNNEDPNVRQTLAEQGYGLDKLINDKDYSVRKAVAQQGYGLDILINDKNDSVSATAIEGMLNKKKEGKVNE